MTDALAGRRDRSELNLVHSHFVMQEERPSQVRDVEIAALDPFLRGLLFTDGTVTRALSVHMLSRVAVQVVDQVHALMPKDPAASLGIETREDSIRRRVTIGTVSPAQTLIWAESHLVPRHLPPGFLRRLDRASDGIGESLQQSRLESWRELLWFGLDELPEWSDESTSMPLDVLSRLYRVTTGGLPAMLISEKFAVELRNDVYSLRGCQMIDSTI